MHLYRRYTYLDRYGPEIVENYVGAVDKVQITQVYEANVESVLLGGQQNIPFTT
jgi:hypothetical protein